MAKINQIIATLPQSYEVVRSAIAGILATEIKHQRELLTAVISTPPTGYTPTAEILALELSDCANQLAQLDDKMEQIKKRIVEAEKESAPKGDRKRPLPTIGGMLIKNRINGLIK